MLDMFNKRYMLHDAAVNIHLRPVIVKLENKKWHTICRANSTEQVPLLKTCL